MKRRIGIQGTVTVLGVIAGIALSRFVFVRWSNPLFDLLADVCGLFLIIYGFLLRVVSRGYKEEESEAGKKLVRGGPYAAVRNPMYFGTFFIACGVIIMLFKLWVFFIFLSIYLAIYLPEIKKEERILAERFGEEYQEYCRITPKYFPCPGNLFNFKLFFNNLKKAWFKKELPALSLTLIIILAIEAWQDIGLFGAGVFLAEGLALGAFIFVLRRCLRCGIIDFINKKNL